MRFSTMIIITQMVHSEALSELLPRILTVMGFVGDEAARKLVERIMTGAHEGVYCYYFEVGGRRRRRRRRLFALRRCAAPLPACPA